MSTIINGASLSSPAFTGVPTAPTAVPGTNTTQIATTAFVLANSSSQIPVVLSGGTDAINPHVSATYIVTTAGVDSMTIAAPTVTTDDGVIITITNGSSASHTGTFSGGTLRSGAAGVTTATFGAHPGSSFTFYAYQGVWYVKSQNLMASFT
jgi:hypothetical protein